MLQRSKAAQKHARCVGTVLALASRMKRKPSKLPVPRETVRTLSNASLAHVAGGVADSNIFAGCTSDVAHAANGGQSGAK
jgi:hypothetical protein